MTNNCLVTKLKGVVQNDNLLKLGVLKLDAKQLEGAVIDHNSALNITADEAFNVSVSDGGYFALTFAGLSDPSKRLTSLDIPANTVKILYFKNDNYKVYVSNKYALTKLELAIDTSSSSYKKLLSFNIEDIAYCMGITSINIINSDVYGDISAINKLTGLQTMYCSNNQISGDISNLSRLTDITHLTFAGTGVYGDISALSGLTELTSINFTGTGVYGDISALSGLTELTSINFTGNTNITGDISRLGALTSLSSLALADCHIEGTLESFVSAQVTNGRSSVSLTSPIPSANLLRYVTFGGNNKIGRCFIAWEGTTKIVAYLDGTSSSDYTTSQTIWAKGASASEIAEWEQAGKTVVVII